MKTFFAVVGIIIALYIVMVILLFPWHCVVEGTSLVTNQIDLRPFYTVSPSIATLFPSGATKMSISFIYPQDFTID